MIYWLLDRGVETHTEDDGRMFPSTNKSQTIIDCFMNEAEKLGVQIKTEYAADLSFLQSYDAVLMTAGSSELVWKDLENHGVPCVPRVPSLFTFHINDKSLHELSGISVPHAQLEILDSKIKTSGPLLITHWGMSGPGILRLSAWGARELADKKYLFTIEVNWLNDLTLEETEEKLKELKLEHSKKAVSKKSPFEFPNRLWESLVFASDISEETKWADLTKKQIQNLALQLTQGEFQVNGKSTFKEEFVTAGGIDLKEINFKTMESKLHANLYFAGEILNIDAITGGFNFQNAWTGGFIIGEAIQ
jgi:predicted Rossmann fold flavoprotein